ncbi:Hpt domain-containing protein, partial [Desulfosarcina cetonica]
ELLNTIFRSLHTIKGASEYLGFSRMAELTHRLENLLTLFREGQLSVDKVAVDLLIDSRDRMGDLIVQIESTGRESAEIEDLLGRISGVTTGPAADEGSVPSSV